MERPALLSPARDTPARVPARARAPALHLGWLTGALRTAGALVSVLLSLAWGLGVLAATRERRRANNAMIALWVVLARAVSGVRLEVKGARHLEEARPAVFLFNHQSAADILIMCMLLRRDFTGLAKREIRRNPFLGWAFAFGGAVFIDRSDRESAVRSLQTAVETIRAGISVGAAPEGTRSPGRRVGPFKKGPFRLAMAAQVPVVPIVIRNAGDVVSQRGLLVTPATVDVVVHPPIPTVDWTLETLPDEIAAVRLLYERTLASATTPPPADNRR